MSPYTLFQWSVAIAASGLMITIVVAIAVGAYKELTK